MAEGLIQTFIDKAGAVSAVVKTVSCLEASFSYTVDLCHRKKACRLLLSGCESPLSANANALCNEKQQRIIAAPGLDRLIAAQFSRVCDAQGITFLGDGLRDHLAGIDVGFTFADYGVADTGTLIIDATCEDVRLTTMVSEIHVAVLPISKIHGSAMVLKNELSALVSQPGSYTTFVTGASRTADIERVLALGVHGPLELHILLLEGEHARCQKS